MDFTFYTQRTYDVLDCLAENVAFYYGKVLRSINFKISGSVCKLIIRAFHEGQMYVSFTDGYNPREALEIFYRRFMYHGKMGNIWYVSKY